MEGGWVKTFVEAGLEPGDQRGFADKADRAETTMERGRRRKKEGRKKKYRSTNTRFGDNSAGALSRNRLIGNKPGELVGIPSERTNGRFNRVAGVGERWGETTYSVLNEHKEKRE